MTVIPLNPILTRLYDYPFAKAEEGFDQISLFTPLIYSLSKSCHVAEIYCDFKNEKTHFCALTSSPFPWRAIYVSMYNIYIMNLLFII